MRPPQDQIVRGWGAGDTNATIQLGISSELERVCVCGSFLSVRPVDNPTWYIRPLTLFEAKAVANTLLYILEISPTPLHDAKLYFDAFYYASDQELRPDYTFAIDAVSRRHGFDSFYHALTSASLPVVRHLLIISGGLAWFALHAPPTTEASEEAVMASNPVLRFIAGLAEVRPFTKDDHLPSSVAALCLEWERGEPFKALSQSAIPAALERTSSALEWLDQNFDAQIWDPDVRSWFRKWHSLSSSLLSSRDASYNSLLGNPDNGNPRTGARNDDDLEIFYSDYEPHGGMAEWLTLRTNLLFTYLPLVKLDQELVRRLDEHFLALFVPWFCEHCGSMHLTWTSRHEPTISLRCPKTGGETKFNREEMRSVYVPGPHK